MSNIVLLVDFGSTFTKVAAVDLDTIELIAKAQSPSTVNDNLLFGLQNGIKKLIDTNHIINEDIILASKKYACSSAAGGLSLIAIGLVPTLTLEAARMAALGAGAKVIGSYSYELTAADVKKIENSSCDIILLSGGTDGGNKDFILHNAEMIAGSCLNIPIVIAGNRSVSEQVKEILDHSKKYSAITENVLPEIDTLNVDPARSCIREIFMKRIIHAKGLDKAQDFIGDILMPTPLATLKAAQLLADGYREEPGIGELLVVEIGGATTNIHSVAHGYKVSSRNIQKGLPEPYSKRTVEGDLGIRYNAETILGLVTAEKVCANTPGNQTYDKSQITEYAASLRKNVNQVPVKECDYMFDIGLARSAVEIAVERHCGYIQQIYIPPDMVNMQYGKDLTEINTVIGTGGIFAYNPQQKNILEAALFNEKNPCSLKPKSPRCYIDSHYLLYGVGLLSESEPVKALKLAKRYLKLI
jgi:uncharacterized protein (TIGR01319 family)